MRRFPTLCLLFCLAGSGCKKSSPNAPPEVAAATNEAPAAIVPETDISATLALMTQAVRKYSAENRAVPPSLQALQAGGYLKDLPQPPAGKSFAIDSKNLRVILK